MTFQVGSLEAGLGHRPNETVDSVSWHGLPPVD